jgi:hypothetical protein
MADLAAATEQHSREVEARIEKRHDELMREMRDMRSEIKSDLAEVKKDSKTSLYWTIGFCFATLLAIAALVVSVVIN